MDEFFRAAPRHGGDEAHEPREPPEWFEPPRDVIAALVPDRRVLASSDRLTLLLSHIDAFPVGARLHVRIMARRAPGMTDDDWWDLHDVLFEGRGRRRRTTSSELPDEFLRFGVEFSDGRKATNVERFRPPHRWNRDEPPEGPMLTDHGGGGGGSEYFCAQNRPLWLWPLPPPEPFDLVFQWPAFDIPLTRVAVDGAPSSRFRSEHRRPGRPSNPRPGRSPLISAVDGVGRRRVRRGGYGRVRRRARVTRWSVSHPATSSTPRAGERTPPRRKRRSGLTTQRDLVSAGGGAPS